MRCIRRRPPLSLVLLASVSWSACTPRIQSAAPAGFIAPAAFQAGAVRSELIAPGVLHVQVRDESGPWVMHVVEIAAEVCGPALEARKPRGPLSARATTSALAADALLGINADFFRLPGGTPVGAHVHAGVPFIGPTDWPVFAVTADGRWHSAAARLSGAARSGRDSAQVAQVNRPSVPFTAWRGTADGLVLFTSRADTVPADAAALYLQLRLLDGNERSGSGIVVSSDTAATAFIVPQGSAAMLAYGTARAWAARRTAGDTVRWSARVLVPGSVHEVVESVGGFPALLSDGRDLLGTQAVREDFGLRRHPRTAVGWTADGRRLFLVVVDGRQAPYSDGMTLPELVWLFRRLGAADAINLDGGGSTALVIRGTLVNRPSDAQGERSVGNALVLRECSTPGRS